MSLKGSARVEHETSEVQNLRTEVQLMIGDSQAFLLDAMRSMLVGFKRDNSRSESGSVEGSAAVGESPEGAGPTAVGQNPAGAGPTAVRRRVYVTEVCGISERRDTGKLLFLSRLVQRGISQTSQGGLERWVHTLAAIFGLPSSRLACKHPPTCSGLREDCIPWTRDTRYCPKGVGFLAAFVSTPPQ